MPNAILIGRRWLLFLVLTTGWLLLANRCYHDTNCTFLRAESGYYQRLVHSDARERAAVVRDFFLHSHHGHYMPFAVLAEIETTRLLGLRASAWKYRAIIVIALLGSALSSLIYRVAIRSGGVKTTSAAIALALTSLIVLHPLLREFVAFPTLIFQLTWMVLHVLTLGALLEAVAHPEQPRWVWIAAACAYASMHSIGLGAITAAATAAALGFGIFAAQAGKFPQLRASRAHWIYALLLLLVLSGLHLAAMQMLGSAADVTPEGAGQPLRVSSMMSFAGFIPLRAQVCFYGACYVWDMSVQEFESRWPIGLVVIVTGFCAWIVMVRRSFASPKPEAVARCFLHSVTFFCLGAFVVLVAARVPTEPKPDWFRHYLSNARYVVPAMLLLLPSMMAWALSATRRSSAVLVSLCLVFVSGAFLGNKTFHETVYKRHYPARLRHEAAWNAIVKMVQECRASQLPVPDVPTAMLGEFPWHLHDYEPLLRHSLGLSSDQQVGYVSWESLDAESLARYAVAVPTLQTVMRDLALSDATTP